MGMIFEAEHIRLHRNVAVKLLSTDLTTRPDLVARFRQEAEIVSQLEHPHIVSVLDFDVTEQGEPYLVLELLHGETLEHRIDRKAPLALEDVIKITTQIASALSVAHRASVVHRDLKPSNIFLTDASGESVFVKLLDFGISKNLRTDRHITHPRTLVGTPEYMAPEQARGENHLVDSRTDEYALAVVAYEMITNLQPFAHADLKEILARVVRLEAVPPSTVAPWITAEVDAVLARAMAKDPASRYGDVVAFAREFATAAAGQRPEPSLVPSSTPPRSGVREGETRRACDVQENLEHLRAALHDGSIEEASAVAEAVLSIADESHDPAVTSLVRMSEALLAHVLMCRIGSRRRRLFATGSAPLRDLPLSPRAAFLLSRIDSGMKVGDLLDVAGMPHLEALRWLVTLLSCGAVRLDEAETECLAANR
jgi:serine/threonine-protein kinase